MALSLPIHGRGTPHNPATRFIPIYHERDPDWNHADDPAPQTQFLRDNSKSILTRNDSPDIPFQFSLNVYRGCEHGCPYCYARPTHEYLSLSAGLDFETRIIVKEDAPELLRRGLDAATWEPQTISMSSVTDAYQPVERRLQLTRRCLEVLADFRNPVGIVTKNALVTRDIDHLRTLARFNAAMVFISITSLDAALARTMEPRASTPTARLRAIETLTDAGIPVGVFIAPVIPGLNDHEMPNILKAAYDAGARWANYVVVRLPLAVAGLFESWLNDHYPDQKEKIMGRIKEAHGGQVYDSRFGVRMRGQGIWADMFHQLFHVTKKKIGYIEPMRELSTAAFRRSRPVQQFLFE